MDNIVRYKGIIRDLTGVELCLHMCKLLVSDGAVTQHKAAGHGIKIVTEGMTVRGVLVGTDDYISRPTWTRALGAFYTTLGRWTTSLCVASGRC